jgi:D-alanyl-D-alanine carboxypeptidase (penicillin-binding protein 5/6)
MGMRFLFVFLFVVLTPLSVEARQSTSAKQAYIVDYETGQVLFDKNSEQQMPTSSMSKVMTMYMVFDALKSDVIDLNSKFRVSTKAWAKGGSKMFVKEKANVKISDLIRGVIVQSGNDATIVLAEGLAGSEEKFARMMTDKAKEIGMINSNFMNASGWPDPDHYSTAKDLTILAKRMIEDFPEYYRYYSETEFTYNAIKQANRNPLLYRDIGADGLKTGHTEVGGYGLIGTAKKDGRRVVMVLNGMESEQVRAEEATRLINWALNHFENRTVIKKGTEVSRLPVTMSKEPEIAVMTAEDVKITIPKIQRDKIEFDVHHQAPLIAPIKARTQVAELEISIPDQGSVRVPLYAMRDVEELGFFGKIWFKIKHKIFGAS